MNKLREKFNPLLENRIYNHEIVVNKLEQITDDFSVKFAEWVAFNYLKLNGVWVGMYQDQRNKDNWKTTTELQQYFKNNIYGKE